VVAADVKLEPAGPRQPAERHRSKSAMGGAAEATSSSSAAREEQVAAADVRLELARPRQSAELPQPEEPPQPVGRERRNRQENQDTAAIHFPVSLRRPRPPSPRADETKGPRRPRGAGSKYMMAVGGA